MAKKELAKKPTVVRVTTKEDKKTALEGALKQIEKKYGAGARYLPPRASHSTENSRSVQRKRLYRSCTEKRTSAG